MSFEDDRGNFESTLANFRARTLWVVIFLAILGGFVLLFLTQSFFRRGLLEQVRVRQGHAPEEALQLLEQAIADVGGIYPDAQIMKCKLVGASQSWVAAERYYDTIESPQLCDQRILIELAVAANQGHAAWLAAKVLESADRPGPDQEQVVRLLLSVKYDLGEMGAVLQLCEELAQLAPKDPTPWLVSAGVHHAAERLSPALIDYQKALDRSPPEQESLRIRFQIAEISLHLGDFDTAEHHIQILRKLSPGTPPTEVTYAKLLRRQGRGPEAVAIVERVVAKEPRFPGGLMLRGLLRFDEGDFRAAAESFRAVIGIDPYNYTAHYKLGQAYQQLGMTDESERHFEQSRRLTDAMSQILFLGKQLDQYPTSRELRLKLAEKYRVLGNVQSAEHWRQTAEGIR